MVRRKVTLAGRYRLEEPLGRGGMGEVWRGVDLRLRRPVAVKILPLTIGAEPAGMARFRREAEVAATLNHPGITTVFDIDEHPHEDERWLFLVMELMVGTGRTPSREVGYGNWRRAVEGTFDWIRPTDD
ncbi:hypothetical protein NE236_17965 [Actinoallomurus purpureus]|uniref:protein kinase domain-containing protein n=1 Tax=Actinoallomurus purpureus TaxID=478114 RepID=UPI002091FC3F|nr:protein kinase [Actinoallomurus purpureus]MCO6006876.1 hypothetical protein [Actinoallomurus purpureus]